MCVESALGAKEEGTTSPWDIVQDCIKDVTFTLDHKGYIICQGEERVKYSYQSIACAKMKHVCSSVARSCGL